MYNGSQTVNASQFPGSTLDWDVELDVISLKLGQYLVNVTDQPFVGARSNDTPIAKLRVHPAYTQFSDSDSKLF